MSRKICIINGSQEYYRLFLGKGFELVPDIFSADLVCFTGGEDVSPHLYDEAKHVRTFNSPARDAVEKSLYDLCVENKIPMVGICRGGQFLNVMNGGKMYQHVTNHTQDHLMKIVLGGESVLVSSTHHQMMRAGKGGVVLATANQKGSKEYMHKTTAITAISDDVDTEVVYYRASNSLCFQPHPEFSSVHYEAMRKAFFDMIEMYLFPKPVK